MTWEETGYEKHQAGGLRNWVRVSDGTRGAGRRCAATDFQI